MVLILLNTLGYHEENTQFCRASSLIHLCQNNQRNSVKNNTTGQTLKHPVHMVRFSSLGPWHSQLGNISLHREGLTESAHWGQKTVLKEWHGVIWTLFLAALDQPMVFGLVSQTPNVHQQSDLILNRIILHEINLTVNINFVMKLDEQKKQSFRCTINQLIEIDTLRNIFLAFWIVSTQEVKEFNQEGSIFKNFHKYRVLENYSCPQKLQFWQQFW